MLVLNGDRPAAAISFTPDGTRIVAAMVGGWPPEIWTLATGARVRLQDSLSGQLPSLAVHPFGRHAFVAHGALTTVALDEGTARTTTPYVADSVIASRDGKWLVTSVYSSPSRESSLAGYLCAEDGVVSAQPVWNINFKGSFHLGAFVGTGDQFVTIEQGKLVIRDTATGEEMHTERYPSSHINARVGSPDGSRFAVMGYGKLYLWNTTALSKPIRVAGYSLKAIALAFHPRRPILATIQSGQTLVKFLDADTGKVVSKFQWKLGGMYCVAFSPDGTLAAAGSASGKIVVWDVD